MNITNSTFLNASQNDTCDVTKSILLDESVKENRKVMQHFINKINDLKNKSYTNKQIFKECNDIIDNYLNNKKKDHDLFTLNDEERNTRIWKYLNKVLHRCVLKESVEFTQIILEIYNSKLVNKNDLIEWIEKRNSQGVTALEIASQRSNKENIHLIYSYYENNNFYLKLSNNDESNVFHRASKKNEIYPIVYFYEKLKENYPTNILNFKNKGGIIPLHYACYCGNKRIIDLLLDFSSDINAQDNDGNTPLHYAVNSSNNNWN